MKGFIPILTVITFFLFGCKSASVLSKTDLEREGVIFFNSKQASLAEILDICTSLDVVMVEESYSASIQNLDRGYSYFLIGQNLEYNEAKLRVIYRNKGSELLFKVRDKLLHVRGVLHVMLE